MTPQQKQKIRDEFEKKYPFLRDEGPTDNEIEHFCNEEVADWWLSILDKELEEERKRIGEKLLATYGRISQPALVIIETFEGHNEQRPALQEVIDLIHNK